MTDTRPEEYNSSPIVLGIAGTVIAGALLGWMLLNNSSTGSLVEEAQASTISDLQLPQPDEEATPTELLADLDPAPVAEIAVDIDADLRKARLAADADLLVSPPRQNALFFYGRVLGAAPDHPVANAELDSVMAGITIVVDDHLAVGEFDEAYDLALGAARYMPDHPSIEAMRQDLNNYAAELVASATVLAEEGNDEEAAAIIDTLDGLPGLSMDYVTAAREQIAGIQESRLDEAQVAQEAEQVEPSAEELSDWQQNIRDAIVAGNLLAPEGESAKDYLAQEVDIDAESRDVLSGEFYTALLDKVRRDIESGELDDTETYLSAAAEIEDTEALEALRAEVNQALIEREGNTPVAMSAFVPLNTAPAKYPERANQRGIVGWVEVGFTVTPTGETADINVLNAEPANYFEESVLQAVEQWKFEPKVFRGQPIAQKTAARLVFDIQ